MNVTVVKQTTPPSFLLLLVEMLLILTHFFGDFATKNKAINQTRFIEFRICLHKSYFERRKTQLAKPFLIHTGTCNNYFYRLWTAATWNLYCETLSLHTSLMFRVHPFFVGALKLFFWNSIIVPPSAKRVLKPRYATVVMAGYAPASQPEKLKTTLTQNGQSQHTHTQGGVI